VSDLIRIRGLVVQARVGVSEEERARTQNVVLDVDVATDLRRAAASDDLADTIDYGAVVTAIADAVRSTEARLLEHLAARAISAVSRMDGVANVTLEIAKESPPVTERVEAIGVRIEGHKS
jgi:dihydroneopterin aldolase